MNNSYDISDIEKFKNLLKEVLKLYVKDSGDIVLENILENFESESFDAKKWKSRKHENPATRREDRRALLVKSGNLRRSFRVDGYTDTSVNIASDIAYAEAHNTGNPARKLPQRQMVGENKKLKKELEKYLLFLIKKKFKK